MTREEAVSMAKRFSAQLPPIRTEDELNVFSQALKKELIENALKAELDFHLNEESEPNSRNGYSPKTIKTCEGEILLSTPRDRNSTFELILVKKGQRRISCIDDKILALYARGMSTRDIEAAFLDMYGVEVSPALISKVTEAVMDEVVDWQNRPLEAMYPILYLDCITVNVRQDKHIVNKSTYLALAVNMDGKKELLGMWISEHEGSKFWLLVLTELKNRGVKSIYVACVDGLTGFPDAINTVFPKTRVQLCIVHMLRNSFKYVSYKDRKEVASDLKRIYQSVTAEAAEKRLDEFALKWDKKYPSISAMWRRNWANIVPFFDYPEEIRRVIYTTNVIESLNSVIRKAIHNRKIFPDDSSVFKMVYLAIERASRKWTMPIKDWKAALNWFVLENSTL
jgi:transposase-like protein